MSSLFALAVGGALMGDLGAAPAPIVGSPSPPIEDVAGNSVRSLQVTVAEAQELVARWIGSNVRGPQAWHKRPPLRDITTPEIEKRLNAQVFEVADFTSSIEEAAAYLIRGKRVVPFSTGFGGSGLLSMAVCDLDGSGGPELAYSYSWGSGMHRSELGLLEFAGERVMNHRWNGAVGKADVVLRKTGDGVVHVFLAGNGKGSEIRLGQLRLSDSKKERKLQLERKRGLAPKFAKLIWE